MFVIGKRRDVLRCADMFIRARSLMLQVNGECVYECDDHIREMFSESAMAEEEL